MAYGASHVSWSPDGNYLAVFNWDYGYLWVFDLDVPESPTISAESVSRWADPSWSTDGRWLAYSRPGKLVVRSADGNEVHELDVGIGVKWSPRGQHYLISERWIVEVGSWTIRQLDLPEDAIILDWMDIDALE
jgi:Tol biopolymer transport system component